jgi:eukaryotic-like serine/threonine-protein kinase
MTNLVASKPADEVSNERERDVAFVPHFWADQGLSRYSLGPFIAVSETSMVRLGVVAGGAQFARLVAIKQLKPAVIRQQSHVARFEEELRIHARVRHPNVVELLDVVESGGEAWLVLEHIDGAMLATLGAHRHATGRPLEPELAVGIIAQLLRALHAVHETKDDAGLPLCIVHCGVSSRHVMVDRDGQVKLLDFGAARAVGERSTPAPRRVPGRFGHLSPELVLGQKVDRRSDVFAVGVLLWELLAGRPLFQESGVSDAEGLRRVLKAPIPKLRDVRPGVPKMLGAILHKALQRDPKKRFATAEDFVLALEAAVTPASPSRLAALAAELGDAHFELTRQALATVRRSLPTPLTVPQMGDELDGEDPTTLMTAQFTRGDTLSPAIAEVSRPAPRTNRSPARTGVVAALLAAALAGALVVGMRKPAVPATASAAAPQPSVWAEPAAKAIDDLLLAEQSALLAEQSALPAEPSALLTEPVPVESLPLSTEPTLEEAPSKVAGASRPRHRGARPTRAAVPPTSRPARSSSCSPPTFLGEDGIRHFKEHCI